MSNDILQLDLVVKSWIENDRLMTRMVSRKVLEMEHLLQTVGIDGFLFNESETDVIIFLMQNEIDGYYPEALPYKIHRLFVHGFVTCGDNPNKTTEKVSVHSTPKLIRGINLLKRFNEL